MSRAYGAIDPGKIGFVAIQCDGKFDLVSIADNDKKELANRISDIRNRYSDLVFVMEEVHSIFGSSAKGTFSFGEIYGYLQGLIVANGIPYVLVQPKTWQKEIWCNSDLVVTYKTVIIKEKDTTRKDVNTKQTSINAAKRLFPNIDFRRTTRCKKVDDNKVDAVLISEYARRKNL